MKLSIRGVANRGEVSRERLILDVRRDIDIGDYLLLCTGYNPEYECVTIGVLHAFWFPYHDVEADDVVVLYTKQGKNIRRKDGDRTVHFFYWGHTSCLWDSEDSAPVILNAPEWEFVPPENIEIRRTRS